MATQNFPAVRNRELVRRVVVVGTPAEHFKAGKISKYRPQVELLHVEASAHGRKNEGELRRELTGHLQTDKNTLVISDVGEQGRPYPFELLSADVKESGGKAAFALLTDRKECVGSGPVMERFVGERQIAAPEEVLSRVNYIFHNDGDEKVYPTMLRLHEDSMNFKNDSERNILVVEDWPKSYTGFLTSLYNLNRHRTRVLLARTFEQAAGLIEECKNRFAGAIIDVEFPKKGELVTNASWELVSLLRKFDEKVPVIFQSLVEGRLPKNDPRVFSLRKGDRVMLQELKRIMNDYFGFGDFVFRRPDGTEIIRAATFEQFFELLQTIEPESLVYHASHDHFSNWLWLHGQKKAAMEFKPISDEDPQRLRNTLISLLEPYTKPI